MRVQVGSVLLITILLAPPRLPVLLLACLAAHCELSRPEAVGDESVGTTIKL